MRLTFIAAAATLTVAITVSASSQSLAEVAKKTEEQRAEKAEKKDTAKPATKTYTNKDLKDPILGGVGSSASPITAEEPPPAATPKPAADFKKDESYWRERMRSVHAKVDDDRTLLAAAIAHEHDLDQRLHKSADNQDYIRDRILRVTVDQDWRAAVTEVGRLRALVVNDERAVKTAEEEARRAEVPPAWLVR